MLKAASFIDFEHEGANFVKFALFLIDNSNHVHSLGSHIVESTKVNVLEAHVDKVSEFFSILEITVINKLHKQEIVKEKLGLWVLHDL